MTAEFYSFHQTLVSNLNEKQGTVLFITILFENDETVKHETIKKIEETPTKINKNTCGVSLQMYNILYFFNHTIYLKYVFL